MDYIREKAPPVREDRLKACSAYGGSCCSLVDKGRKGCLNGIDRKFAQTQICQLNLSLAIINTIRDIVVIVHGPIGCAGGSLAQAGVNKNFKQLRDSTSRGLLWVNTNLGENEVINGGENNLREAILYADKEFRPSAIVIVNSCVPAIIGDDVDSVVEQAQKEVEAKIVPVHCEGFKTKIAATAYDAVYHGILRSLITTEPAQVQDTRDEFEILQEKYRASRTINVLNVSSMSRIDEYELVRLLKALDLNLNILPCYAHPEDFQKATESALNVSICATHDDYFSEHLKTLFNIPFILRTIPIGVKYTNRWLLDIAKFFDIEKQAQQFIDQEVKLLEEGLAPFREIFKGKRALIGGGEIRVIANAELLTYLGFEVVGLRAYHYDQFGDEMLDEQAAIEQATFNVATGQPFEQANLIAKLKPDLFVGHVGGNVWAAKQGIPCAPLFHQSQLFLGYAGIYEFARRVARILKNPSFNRSLGANSQLPYFDNWYKKDAFSYIDEGDLQIRA
ncbi:MAG TPA: nitrogenase component 1 [Methylomusa anaerophila]|uniref:Nitrogenase molybdenum-iron protein alpha chain n=1 Tax=Methylomusa anaerophila TaxID=1930071 RepID=A0A348AEU7_9FIRM|nr:nitrogenase component 1 [Methylomusa anaerophila]BBB89595.1 nitrogenase molybdenum-iron protein alpha chain [Methylomusa anaerophila]HML89632.1 nitrogenase component 1 [Methylomusa anaerophila]